MLDGSPPTETDEPLIQTVGNSMTCAYCGQEHQNEHEYRACARKTRSNIETGD